MTGNVWNDKNLRDYNNIPAETLRALIDYVEFGREPGHFVCAVLANDLQRAYARADLANIRALWAIATFVYNRMPMSCHGDSEKISTWCYGKGLAQSEAAGQIAAGSTASWREKALEGISTLG